MPDSPSADPSEVSGNDGVGVEQEVAGQRPAEKMSMEGLDAGEGAAGTEQSHEWKVSGVGKEQVASVQSQRGRAQKKRASKREEGQSKKSKARGGKGSDEVPVKRKKSQRPAALDVDDTGGVVVSVSPESVPKSSSAKGSKSSSQKGSGSSSEKTKVESGVTAKDEKRGEATLAEGVLYSASTRRAAAQLLKMGARGMLRRQSLAPGSNEINVVNRADMDIGAGSVLCVMNWFEKEHNMRQQQIEFLRTMSSAHLDITILRSRDGDEMFVLLQPPRLWSNKWCDTWADKMKPRYKMREMREATKVKDLEHAKTGTPVFVFNNSSDEATMYRKETVVAVTPGKARRGGHLEIVLRPEGRDSDGRVKPMIHWDDLKLVEIRKHSKVLYRESGFQNVFMPYEIDERLRFSFTGEHNYLGCASTEWEGSEESYHAYAYEGVRWGTLSYKDSRLTRAEWETRIKRCSMMRASALRIEIVLFAMNEALRRVGNSLTATRKNRVVTDIFPLHDKEHVSWLKEKWGSLKLLYWPTLQESWKDIVYANQPIEEIRCYFGETVAFYFAFLQHYSRALILPAAAGFIATIWLYAAGHNSTILPIYCVGLIIWSCAFLELWKRKQGVIRHVWGISDAPKETQREGFVGEETVDPYTQEAVLEDKSPLWKRKLSSMSLVLMSMGVVVGLMTSLLLSRVNVLLAISGSEASFSGKLLFGIITSVGMAVMNKVYNSFVGKINDMENHRTEEEYTDALIIKLFVFQFINNYITLFWLAFHPGDLCRSHVNHDGIEYLASLSGDTCSAETMETLETQLIVIFVFKQIFNNVLELGIPRFLRYLRSRKEEAAMKKMGVERVKLSEVGKQAKMAMFDPFDDYNEMVCALFTCCCDLMTRGIKVIQFGYITMFAAGFPIAALTAYINNIVEVRVDASKLLYSLRRPLPDRTRGVGAWLLVMEIIAALSVVTNCLMMGFSSNSLVFDSGHHHHHDDDSGHHDGCDALWIAVALEHSVLALRGLMSIAIPDDLEWVRQQKMGSYKWMERRALPDVSFDDDDDESVFFTRRAAEEEAVLMYDQARREGTDRGFSEEENLKVGEITAATAAGAVQITGYLSAVDVFAAVGEVV